MDLSISDIRADIEEYQRRIKQAQAELAGLPGGFLPYPEHKKREKIRRDCESDIKHYSQLIVYATTGISIRQEGE